MCGLCVQKIRKDLVAKFSRDRQWIYGEASLDDHHRDVCLGSHAAVVRVVTCVEQVSPQTERVEMLVVHMVRASVPLRTCETSRTSYEIIDIVHLANAYRGSLLLT